MKKCSSCNILQNEEMFFKKGKNRLRSVCKSCHNKSGVARRQGYKLDAINYLGSKCIRCKYNKCQAALEFHHRDPSKKDFTFSKNVRSLSTVKSELDKCDLLCSNCHKEIHQELEDQFEFKIDLDSNGKVCTLCNLSLNTNSFKIRKSTGNLNSWCNNCIKKNQRKRRKDIKLEIVEYLGGKCSKCNYNKSTDALELHHILGEKEFSISANRKRLNKIKDEVDKCILLCSNCHKEEHFM